jgi:hypothetical protein
MEISEDRSVCVYVCVCVCVCVCVYNSSDFKAKIGILLHNKDYEGKILLQS